jgi:hypothetical protein
MWFHKEKVYVVSGKNRGNVLPNFSPFCQVDKIFSGIENRSIIIRVQGMQLKLQTTFLIDLSL